MNKPTWIYDCECYSNYFLVVFLNIETLQWCYYEKFNDIESWPLAIPEGLLIGFNSKNYDHPMLSAAFDGVSNHGLKQLSDEIIVGRKMWWTHNNLLELDHIDIIEVLPGKASLKIYGGRNGSKKLQDLPINPSATITPEQVPLMRYYCLNDCIVTKELVDSLKQQIALRVQMSAEYNIDLRSKSDAQIAEAVLTSEYEKLTGTKVTKPSPDSLIGRSYRYAPPAYIKFQTPYLQELLQEIIETDFVVGEKGSIGMPKNLTDKVIEIESMLYKVATGGIHSVDKPSSFCKTNDFILEDVDVAGYYPAIIIMNGYEPREMANGFNEIYKTFYEDRMTMKRQVKILKAELMSIDNAG